MSTVNVSTTTELLSALGAASPGDRIALAPGRYDGVTLRNYEFDGTVTITSADPNDRAVFDDNVWIFDSAGLAFEQVDFIMADLADAFWVPAVRLQGTENVRMSDVTIAGQLADETNGLSMSEFGAPGIADGPIEEMAWGTGMWISQSTGTVLEQIEIRDFVDAIHLNVTTDTRISHAHLHHLRSDGIKLSNTTDTVIEHSLFHSNQPAFPPNALHRADHGDFLQAYVLNQPIGIDGLTVRGNVFAQGDGRPTHTFFGALTLDSPRADEVSFTDIEISDNLVHTAHIWGFALFDSQDITLEHNTLLPAPADPTFYNSTGGVPFIAIGAASPDPDYGDAPVNVLVSDNRTVGDAVSYRNNDATQTPVNVVIDGNTVHSNDPQDSDYWGTALPGTEGAIVPRADDLRIGQDGVGIRALDPWLVDWLNNPWDTVEQPVEGGEGNDLLEADDTGLKIFGHGGNDTLVGGSVIYTLYG
ncbi:MAG: right-handed parallel beta-helix repeat-containing protein [Pseudomonadota bacterium]